MQPAQPVEIDLSLFWRDYNLAVCDNQATPNTLTRLLYDEVYAADTAHPAVRSRWMANVSSSVGHSDVAALIIQEIFGGDIIATANGFNPDVTTYFNRLPDGRPVVTTTPTPRGLENPRTVTREAMFEEGAKALLEQRYHVLRDRLHMFFAHAH